MSSRRISIKDVAREAGVSVTTVSHALNDKGRLNPETRRRVREVADRLGYQPNPAARSLVSGRTGLIAAMASLPSEGNVAYSEFGYYGPLLWAATAAAVDRDHALVVAPPSRSGFVWDRMSLDGVLIVDPLEGDPALPALRQSRIPFVTIGVDPRGHQDDAVVASDDAGGTTAILDHLRERGGERIGLLSLPPVNGFVGTTIEAYARWSEDHAAEPLLEIMRLDGLVHDRIAEIERGLQALRACGVDAIYAPIELSGLAVRRALLAAGVQIPTEMLLATTYDAGRSAEAGITTLSFDFHELGTRAANLLLDLIEGVRTAPALEVVPTRIEPRASTART